MVIFCGIPEGTYMPTVIKFCAMDFEKKIFDVAHAKKAIKNCFRGRNSYIC